MVSLIGSEGGEAAAVACITKWRKGFRTRLAKLVGWPPSLMTEDELNAERRVLRARLQAIDAELAVLAIRRVMGR